MIRISLESSDDHLRVSLALEYDVRTTANQSADTSNVGSECDAQLQRTRKIFELRVLLCPLLLLSTVHHLIQRHLLRSTSANGHHNHQW